MVRIKPIISSYGTKWGPEEIDLAVEVYPTLFLFFGYLADDYLIRRYQRRLCHWVSRGLLPYDMRISKTDCGIEISRVVGKRKREINVGKN